MATSSKYKPLYTTDKFFTYLVGGRGGAKSYEASEFATRLSYEQGHGILVTRYTLTAADKSIIPEFEEKIIDMGVAKDFRIANNQIINLRTKCFILFSGIKTSSGNQTANLKSLKGISTWIYEEFEEHPDEESFEKIVLSVRAKKVQNRVILLSNALHKKSWQYLYFFENKRSDTEYIYTTYLDNLENLPQHFLDKAEKAKNENLIKYNRDFLGIHFDNIEGALWNTDIIKYKKPESFKRIVVAIDPAVTAKDESNETGIIVCGVGDDNKGYVIEDYSGIYTPKEWAYVAVRAYNKHEADRIIGEVNQGGDLIKANLHNVDKTIPFTAVRATKGKYTRAEPIAGLYEDEKIYHVQKLPKLETQMCTWVPLTEDSPDRVDALVWGFTNLMIKQKEFFAI